MFKKRYFTTITYWSRLIVQSAIKNDTKLRRTFRLHVCSEILRKESINRQKDCHDLKAVFCVSQFPNFNSSWIQISDITCIAASVLLNLQFLCFISNAVLQRAADNSQNLWCCLYCLGNFALMLLSLKILRSFPVYKKQRGFPIIAVSYFFLDFNCSLFLNS